MSLELVVNATALNKEQVANGIMVSVTAGKAVEVRGPSPI